MIELFLKIIIYLYIDFLFKKTSEEIAKLKDKIKPTDVTINVKNIEDAYKCEATISIMKSKKDNFHYLNI